MVARCGGEASSIAEFGDSSAWKDHGSSHSSWINGIHGRDGTNGRTGMAGLGQIRIGRWQSQPEEWAEDTPPHSLNVTDGVGKLPVHQTKWRARSCAMRINNSPCCLVDTLPIGNMWQPTVGMFWACPSVAPSLCMSPHSPSWGNPVSALGNGCC